MAGPSEENLRALLLHNPKAGAGHCVPNELIETVTKAGFCVTYHSTKKKGYKQALREKWDRVIIAGGDGTVARAVRDLRDRRIPIAILPMGTANNVARSLCSLRSSI
jgi:diacylglycerol kinase (ATP)